ncbi:MAG TPA: polyprenyl synthetase family protein [Bacteroidales bacterium]|nr:polyprenyl synthetase family protein [Bacteroidales bacterium]
MLSLADCQKIINRHLNEIELPELPSNLYDPVRYMLCLGAKRIRPSIVLMGCNVFSDSIEHAVYPAMAIEVFHNFTLVHDDIMDKSEVRRNQPTVYMKWSPNIALLSGDAMVIKAYELLSKARNSDLEKILPVFNKTALQVCEGQQFDMDYESHEKISIEEYLEMVEFKTAVLLAASFKIGALTGGASAADADLLYEFGRKIGIAFQLQDDLLDVFSSTEIFGKSTGHDIVSNKKTILLTEALERVTGNTREYLLGWLKKENFIPDEKIRAVKSVYSSLDLETIVIKRINDLYDSANEQLEKLSVEQVRIKELRLFSSYLLNRKK